MNKTCPFCKIAQGKSPASIVYEDPTVLAFMDLNPSSIGHTLVIPREHWENIYDVPEETLADLITVVKKVCVAAKKAFGAEGVRVIQLNGRAAGQVVMHLHFHVIPASFRDGVRMGHHGRAALERNELDAIAQKIRENL